MRLNGERSGGTRAMGVGVRAGGAFERTPRSARASGAERATRTHAAGLVAAVALLLIASSDAQAYPQFQLALDGQCSTCHLSPAGGGPLTDYGRDEAGSTISRGGDGRLFHGAWTPPEWFAMSGDFRFATGFKRLPALDPNEGTEQVYNTDTLIFPMQADLNLRFMKGNFAFALTAGVRGVSQDDRVPIFVERLVSREHYAAYAFDESQIRVGRFFPVWGLRLVDHTAYVRRWMGFNLYEEPYALEYARYGEKTDIHVSAFAPQPIALLGSGYREAGGTALVERRIGDADDTIIGGQARVGIGDLQSRYAAGAIVKRYFSEAELLLMGELDIVRQTFDAGGPGRTQLASYLGAFKWVTRGVLVSGAVHAWEPDLVLRSTTRQAFELAAQYFVRAHFELHLLLRASAQGGTVEDPTYLSLLQLHYYL